MSALVFEADLVDVSGVGARVAVRGDQRLTALHDAIQDAFGWDRRAPRSGRRCGPSPARMWRHQAPLADVAPMASTPFSDAESSARRSA